MITNRRYMSSPIRSILLTLLLLVVSGGNLVDANSSGVSGYGIYGCSCHTTDAMISPAISGIPSSGSSGYIPGNTYSLSWDGGSALSSNGEGGFNLVASAGTWSNLGPRVKTLNGELTHSSDLQRSWTADWIAPVAGTGDVTFNLAVNYANGDSQKTNDNWGTGSWTAGENPNPPNTPPTAENCAINPNGDVYENQAITVSYTFQDPDGDIEANSQVRWFADSVLESNYNDMLTLSSSATSIGQSWTVKVTPDDGTDLGTEVSCPGFANIVDFDSDGDGTVDGDDAFPDDSTQITDSDGDGYGDNQAGNNADLWPNDSTQWFDSDGDGYGDNSDGVNGDKFPADGTQWTDSDGDGYGDNQAGNNPDAFPTDTTQHSDVDGDGFGDNISGNNADAFPNDSTQSADSDGDGYGDNQAGNNADLWPNDSTQWFDSDGDGYGDNSDGVNGDKFPADGTQWTDSDGDGYGDNQAGNNPDAFPTDTTQHSDVDGDGFGDNISGNNADAFPNDANETVDSDDDEVGDNADAFPNDANETMDSDGDEVGDNADAFPNDVNETMDSDLDGVGDNADAFPNDVNETMDSDGDDVGDNADAFPNDANETIDSDGDDVGDNADAFPNDANETMDSDADGVGDNLQLIEEELAASKAAEEKEDKQQLILIIGIISLLIGGLSVVFILKRKNKSVDILTKNESDLNVLPGQNQSFHPTSVGIHQEIAQPVMAQSMIVQPAVVQQWTDESGNTWRSMDNGVTMWWNGNDWQQV